MNVTTNEKHLHFINFVKLIEESNMSEVFNFGSFSADPAALFTVNKNLVTNELIYMQRKPTFGSSLFGIASFDTIHRNWESLCSFETIFNCGNFICKYYGMFSIFSGYFQQRYTNYSITSKHFESFVFFMGYKYEPLQMERFSTNCCLIPVFFHTSKYIWLSSG